MNWSRKREAKREARREARLQAEAQHEWDTREARKEEWLYLKCTRCGVTKGQHYIDYLSISADPNSCLRFLAP